MHWRARGIPPEAGGIAPGVWPQLSQTNSFGRRGYAGPCPPVGGGPHRYLFTLTAQARSGRVLARARLVGRFGR